MTDEQLIRRVEAEVRAAFEKSDKQPRHFRMLANRLLAIQSLTHDDRYSKEITEYLRIANAVEAMNTNMEIYNRKGN